MRYRNIANIDAERTNAAIEAPSKAGLRNRASSSIGSLPRASTTKKTASSTAAPTSMETIRVEPQPSSLPRMSAKMSRNSAPENVTRPAQSTLPARGLRDSSTWASVSQITPTPIGMFTKKMASQPMPSVSTPPASGPTATAAPVTAPQTPKAVPRSRPW